MEVSALNRWISLGKDLYKVGDLQKYLSHVEKINKKLKHLEKTQNNLSEFNIENIKNFITKAIRRFLKGFMYGYGFLTIFNLIKFLLKKRINLLAYY